MACVRLGRTYLLRSVGLVVPVVDVEDDLEDPHFSLELYVHQVRLGAIRLPVRLNVVISQVLDAVPRLVARHGPHSEAADLALGGASRV